ncbi:very short patch repair endonuclease [Luteibacter sp. 9133]|uniref:very short patch repair endonuclease n=1 Tax=Luteibacter sp. 9133 TaxID=1500891 RepID=UPI0018CDA8BD|nr:very short patch repair endonuclease [Luteibacter sp. 9133]
MGNSEPNCKSASTARIRRRHTGPEIATRKLLHKLGFRFRLHVTSLPGTPDIVLPKYRAIIFVNGCFWHGHDCHKGSLPATRRDFWARKIAANRARDQRNDAQLVELGWLVVTVWECALSGKASCRVQVWRTVYQGFGSMDNQGLF